ncbi:uncharacterized protein N7482_008297 [Penicillium canariense]|uniref:Restriction of telomere capping protein 4 n=1 Tax=Penicillium canariense TaxID=189055 RepID=A0A9W9LIL9_9EURO|nr:uncharacterized protein N7482_008297 [Penicillium canariense]KAJ5157197.1 hypothetical protein N7482_008297 [Penicillium canariense]
MRAHAKPDSSYASNRLTRNNQPKRHLLSSFNKDEGASVEPTAEAKPNEQEPAMNTVPLSSDDEPLTDLDSVDIDYEFEPEPQEAELKPEDKNEPATDADPLSSSEDELKDELSDDSIEFRRPNEIVHTKTLEEKLAEESWSAPSSARRGGMTRTLSNMMGDSDEDDFLASWSSTQSSKRARTHTYKSSTSLSRVPSFVARSSATPDKRSPQTKLQAHTAQGKKATKLSDSEPDDGFKVPREIHAPSPRKPRPGKKTRKSSPGFKNPPAFSIDSNSHSSLGASSFKEPQSKDLDDEDSLLSSLSSLPSSPSSEARAQPRPALCPMCKEEVDPNLLEQFLAQPKQRVREQQQFCASHQQQTAKKDWESQGYPDIDWDTFDERVQKHFPELEKLLIPDCSCFYRNILNSTLRSGKAQNFRLTLAGDGLETMSCGYYGTKGSGKMLQALTDRFALKLRRLATSDHIVKQAGVVGYAQSVLVPELAVRLVKEDMGVSDDTARQILRESIALGEKLNPALDDVVPIPDELEESFTE